MSKSIPFVKPINEALPCLKIILNNLGINVTSEAILANGYIKLHMLYDKTSFALILYSKKITGQSTTIVLENETSLIYDFIYAAIQPIEETSVKRDINIQIHCSINIADKTLQGKVEDKLKTSFENIKVMTQEIQQQIYAYKIQEGSQCFTLTQFKTGKLLLQGNYSDLSERIIELINIIKPLTNVERASYLAPEDIQKQIDIQPIIFDELEKEICPDFSEVYNYLSENDKKTYITGLGLLTILQKTEKKLPEYNFLVAQFAKVYEGFIIKLMLDKQFFTRQEFIDNPDVAAIGNALRNRKFLKYIADKRRFSFILDKLLSEWEGTRCKEMHSDPVSQGQLLTVADLVEATRKIHSLEQCIKEAYSILIKNGLTDSDIEKDSLKSNSISTECIIGTDESGKGDYLGPLVIAGVCLTKDEEDRLLKIGVKDSKLISDRTIFEIADGIRRILSDKKISVVLINPERYNSLYSEIENLNQLLAWGHARVIENLLATNNCNLAIADQFGDEEYINNALMGKGKNIVLKQETKAEQYTPVAAASILAREAFLKRLESLSMQYGIEMPKGANEIVEKAAKRFIEKHGKEELSKIAKIHFKTTKRVLP